MESDGLLTGFDHNRDHSYWLTSGAFGEVSVLPSDEAVTALQSLSD
jgi:hypothetical protein